MRDAERNDGAHLLVVDDDDRIRTLLKRFLSEAGHRVTTAADAARARGLLETLGFDLLILDVMMPGEDGLSLTASLRQESDVPILILTARDLPEDRIEGLRRGADDYLPKPFQPEELLLRIDAILRRAGAQAPPNAVIFGEWRYDVEAGDLRRAGRPVKLTTAEAALLSALARNPGETVDRLELSKRTSEAQERSIDVQVTRLRRKIEDDPRTPVFLHTVRGVGYKLIASPAPPV